MQSNQSLRVKNSFLELEKYFMELTDRELKDRKENIKREIEELLHKPIIVSKDDMDKFEEQEMKKIRPIIRTLSDQVINNNMMKKKRELIRDKLKDKIISDLSRIFETNKQTKNRARSTMVE